MGETGFDGMPTALHVAAIKCQLLVLRELAKVQPELIPVLTNQGETALHLTVKWNHLEAVKVLAEEMMKNTSELINWKDCKGNTVLHIAVSNKHLQIVNYLLSLNGLQVNALNKNDLTALDLLSQSPRDVKTMEIEHALRDAGASSFKDLQLLTHKWSLGNVRPTRKTPSSQEPSSKKGVTIPAGLITLLVVAPLITNVAFKAGESLSRFSQRDFTVKGNIRHREPYTIMCSTLFLIPPSTALVSIGHLPVNETGWMLHQILVMFVAIYVQVMAYLLTLGDWDLIMQQ